MVSRGFSSKSFLYESAQTIIAQGTPAYLHYFGDHDPSGVHIDQHIERALRKYARGAEIQFERVAVLESQIEAWNLPTRPTKKRDSRSKKFKGESVEVDAIEPDVLREIVADSITRHIDKEVLKRTKQVEQLERETFKTIPANWE
jgi:hypothetical protein